jgi:hypothetical protein
VGACRAPTRQLIERTTDPLPNFRWGPYAINVTKKVFALIVRDERGGHGVVRIETFADRFLSVIITMLELGGIGGRIILKVVDLSSPDIGPT